MFDSTPSITYQNVMSWGPLDCANISFVSCDEAGDVIVGSL